MDDIFIISAVRSPIGIGKPTGGLNPLQPVDLAALVMQAAVARARTIRLTRTKLTEREG